MVRLVAPQVLMVRGAAMSPVPPGSSLEERVAVIETTVAGIRHEMNTDVADIKADIKDLRESLSNRPSWAVATILAGLGATTSALGATLLTLLVQQS